MSKFPIFSDAAAKSDADKLNFSRYLKPLLSVLTDPTTETPFTIGVFGPWGSGKTTFLGMLNEAIKLDHKDRFVRINFNPWAHRNEPNLLIPLLHTLHDTLQENTKTNVIESAKKIGAVLLRLGADVFLKSVTANTVSLEALEKLEKKYLDGRGMVESEMRRLRKTLKGVVDTVGEDGTKIIIFVDDLDRCDPAQIVDLLEAVKLFLDLQHVFVVLAVDKEVIDRGIEVKYGKFEFAKSRKSALGAEYLEKMVQLPLYLFPLHTTQVRAFINDHNPPQGILDQLDLLEKLLLPNPRKIKRVINILTVINSIVEATALTSQLKADLIARLVVLQVQSGELHAEIVKQPDLLVALEKVYINEIQTNNADKFVEFGDRAASIRKLCEKYHQPESYLGALFKSSEFRKIKKNELSTYLTLIGG
jgi:predicted KAP-like P-loop ATPase